MLLLSIIYVYFNTPNEIIRSIMSLKKGIVKVTYEIIIINNASTQIVPQEIELFKNTKIINNKKNIGYGAALNQGAKLAKGEYLLLLNPDTIFLSKSIDLMINKLKSDSTIGVLGPQFISFDHKVEITGNGYPLLPYSIFAFTFLNKLFPKNLYSNKYFLPLFNRKSELEIPVICGACMMIKKKLFLKINGFDERFFMYFEESDLCLRIKREGSKVLYYPKAKVIHLGGKSTNDKAWIRNVFQDSRYKFFKKYHNVIFATIGEVIIRILNSL